MDKQGIPLNEDERRALEAHAPEVLSLALEYGKQPHVFEDGTHFQSVVRSICHQQVSMASGRAIHNRVQELLGSITPSNFLACKNPRQAGLSQAKVRTVGEVAQAMVDQKFDPATLANASLEDAIGAWTQFWGIGDWTAKMLLMFHDGREDCLAHEDLGVRVAATRHLGFPEDDKLRWAQLRELEPTWVPVGSLVTRVLWQSLEGEPLSHNVKP